MSRSPLSRAKIRSMAARRCGFTPRSSSQLTHLNEEIDNALTRMAGDCPDAFLHNDVEVDVLKTFTLSTYDAAIKLPAGLPAIINERILEITDADGTTLSHATWTPTTDGTWDGRMWLRVVVDGHPYLLQTREWFTAAVQQTSTYYVSLVDPIPFEADDPITDVTVFQRYAYFPSDTTKVKANGQDSGDYYPNIEILDSYTARNRLYSVRDDVPTGHIQYMWKDHRHNIRTPVEGPNVTASSTTWAANNFPKGTFEFCYTYVWGRRSDLAMGESPRGINDPLWESAPSPAGTYTMSDQTTAGIDLQAVNIDALFGFSHPTLVGTAWEGRSGYRIRFYVRVKALVSGSGHATMRHIDTSDQFVLLAEIEPTALVSGNYTVYTWDGQDIPDYERMLKASPGYFGYAMYPYPSDNKTLDFAVRRTPESLEDDAMVVHMQPEGKEALVALIASAIHRADGSKGDAQVEEQRYNELAELIKARYSNPGGFGLPRGMGDYYTSPPEVIATS